MSVSGTTGSSLHPLHQPTHRSVPRLGVLAALILVIVPQAPLGALTFGMSTNFAATGVLGFPLLFGIVGAALLTFGVAAGAVSRRISHPGGLYAVVSHGLGRPAGLGAAFLGLVAYSAMTVTFFLPIGQEGSRMFAGLTGIALPWWLLVSPIVLLVGYLGTRSTRVTIQVLGTLLALQMAMVLVFDVTAIASPGPQGVSGAALEPASLLGSGVSAATAFVLVAFVGAETVASYSREFRLSQPRVFRAAYLGVGVMALIYVVSCWALTVATGPDQVVERSRESRIGLVPGLVGERLGDAVSSLYNGLVLISVFAAALAFHNVAARYLRALADDGVLPAVLGSRRSGSEAPVAGSMVQTVVSLALVLGTGASGEDPFSTLFPWLSDIGGLGVGFLLILTSLAVAAYYLRTDSDESGFVGWEGPVVAGMVSTVTLSVMVLLALIEFDVRLGVPADSPLGYLPPLMLVGVFLAGVGYAAVLRTTRPDVLSRVGRAAPETRGTWETQEAPGALGTPGALGAPGPWETSPEEGSARSLQSGFTPPITPSITFRPPMAK